MNLTIIDWSSMLVYFVFVLGIGWMLKRHLKMFDGKKLRLKTH